MNRWVRDALGLTSIVLTSCSHFDASAPVIKPISQSVTKPIPSIPVNVNNWCGPYAIQTILAVNGDIPYALNSRLPTYNHQFGGLTPKDMAKTLQSYTYNAEVVDFSSDPIGLLRGYLAKDYQVALLVRPPNLNAIKKISELHWVTAWEVTANKVILKDQRTYPLTYTHKSAKEYWDIKWPNSYLGVVAKKE